MRYSAQRREAFGEAFNVISGVEALRFLLRLGAEEVRAGAEIGGSTREPGVSSESVELLGALLGLALAACQVSVGMGLWAMAKIACALLARMRRPRYYPRENSHRERLARQRRRVRARFTMGVCPDPERLIEQYAKAKTGAREALKFGSMLCDLEAHCDNSLVRNAYGEIAGRNPGVKGWLRDNCPELLAHYKNAMRYKGLAERFRQAAGAADPVPAAALAAKDDSDVKRMLDGERSRKITVRMKKMNGPRGGKTISGTFILEEDTIGAAWNSAREILRECEGSADNRPRCGKTYGEVARLEKILDERLDGKLVADLAPSRWRAGEQSSGLGERTGCKSERASA